MALRQGPAKGVDTQRETPILRPRSKPRVRISDGLGRVWEETLGYRPKIKKTKNSPTVRARAVGVFV
jgi:hypothetical protein